MKNLLMQDLCQLKKKLNGTKNKNNNLIYSARKKKFRKTPSFKRKKIKPVRYKSTLSLRSESLSSKKYHI